MTDYLESSRYSVEHAQMRIRELEKAVAEFGNLNPYRQFIEVDAKTGEQIIKVRLTKPMPRPWSGIAFDALHSLRAALDQAGHAVAIFAGSKGKHGHFPFGGNLADAQLRKKARSKDIPQEIFDVMIASKPYKGGNDLLWGLNKLTNTHKHEIIVPLVTESSGWEMRGGLFIKGGGTFHAKWDRSKNELEVARLGARSEIKANFTYKFFIAVGDVELIGGQPAIPLLDAITSEVERILMAVEAEARRIGVFK